MKEKKWIVYKHTSPSNKTYIGITSQKANDRWRSGKGYKNNTYFIKAINKYGWENFKHEILYTDLNKENACNKEIELIDLYDSVNKDKGYNLTKGGEGTIGIESVWKGKHLPKATRIKISKSNKGKAKSDEACKNMRIAQLKLVKSKNYINPMSGKQHSEEAKKKQSDAFYNNPDRQKHLDNIRKLRGTIQYTKDNEYMNEFISIQEAHNTTGIGYCSIQACCAGRQKTAGGYIWKYTE